jgi:hypothetical protein
MLVLAAGIFGVDNPGSNVNPVAIYVVMWVVLQGLVCLMGDLWRVLSPFDTMAWAIERFVGREPKPAPEWTRLAAPVGAAAFLWLELAHPSGDSPRILGLSMLVYTAAFLAGTWRWGRAWLAANETISVLFGLLASMAPVARSPEGALRLRLPLSGLANFNITPAATSTILIVLGGTTFDGFGESSLWRDLAGTHTGWTNAAYASLGLVASISVISALYLTGVRSMSTITGREPQELATLFAPSLVPIAFGYALAHYLQLAFDEIQTFWFRLSDPFGQGWDLFGSADGRIDFTVISPDTIAWVQALGIVIGHIAGVVVAHDRAVATFNKRDAVRSQYVMLMLMVAYSVLGLWLLLEA